MYRSSATTLGRRVRTARRTNVIVPPTEIQTANIEDDGGNRNTPRTPENEQNHVQVVVDLITPVVQPQMPVLRARRPLEVDLTCDLDDEVFVVLVNKKKTYICDYLLVQPSKPPFL